jgi:hypothetical protein
VFAFGACPLAADVMYFGMVFGIEFSLVDGFFVDGVLHFLPLLFVHFDFVYLERIEDVAVNHPRIHGHTAVRFEWSVDTSDYTFFGVEGAGATTLRASLSDSN